MIRFETIQNCLITNHKLETSDLMTNSNITSQIFSHIYFKSRKLKIKNDFWLVVYYGKSHCSLMAVSKAIYVNAICFPYWRYGYFVTRMISFDSWKIWTSRTGFCVSDLSFISFLWTYNCLCILWKKPVAIVYGVNIII